MNSQQNWYKTFFNGLALEVWTKVMTPDYTNTEVQFIKEFIRNANGNILDIPCGNGRHSIALAKEGYTVTSIDIAEEYISSLREVIDKENLPIIPIQADILEYELSGEFDLAICLGNSFSYFNYYQTLEFAKKVYGVLKTGGAFLVNTGAVAESILPSVQLKDWIEVDGILFLSERLYHAESSVLQSNYRIIQKEKIEYKTAYHHVFTLAEIRRLLTEAGFGEIEQYSGFDKTPYKYGDRQAFIVATK